MNSAGFDFGRMSGFFFGSIIFGTIMFCALAFFGKIKFLILNYLFVLAAVAIALALYILIKVRK